MGASCFWMSGGRHPETFATLVDYQRKIAESSRHFTLLFVASAEHVEVPIPRSASMGLDGSEFSAKENGSVVATFAVTEPLHAIFKLYMDWAPHDGWFVEMLIDMEEAYQLRLAKGIYRMAVYLVQRDHVVALRIVLQQTPSARYVCTA